MGKCPLLNARDVLGWKRVPRVFSAVTARAAQAREEAAGGKMRRERRGAARGEEIGGSFVVAQWKSATFGAKVRRLVGGGRTSLCGVCDSASLIQVLLSCHMSQSQ